MPDASDSVAPTGSSFLDSLPGATRARIAPMLQKRELMKGQALAGSDGPFAHVYFPVGSLISTVVETSDGSSVEVGLTGHEGFAPLEAAFGRNVSRHISVVQIADCAFAVKAEGFLAALSADADLRERAARYAEYSFAAAAQFAACNAVHPVEGRYARWMLMAHDRVGTHELALTQDYAAQMLGVRRATITNIALGLSHNELISYTRGKIAIKDRAGLESAACECYAAVNEQFRQLMGYGALHPDMQQLTR